MRDTVPRWEQLQLTLHSDHKPHDYQLDALAAWKQARHLGSIVLPTGAGKTFVAIQAVALVERSTLVIAPTIDLLHQWYARLVNAFRVPVGVYYGGEKTIQPITVTTYHSAGDVMAEYGNHFKLIIYDEVHHLPAPSWGETALMSAAPFRLGLTATYPEAHEQGDGRWRIDELIGPIVYEKRIDDLVGERLAEYRPGQVLNRLAHEGFLNADAARSHPVLKGATIDGVVSVLLGQNADPAVGDPAYSLLVQQERYQTQPQKGQVIPFSASFPNRGDRSGWGVALAVPVTFTDSGNGAAVDGGAASSDGGAAFLHPLQAAASDTYTIIVEGADDSGFTTNVVTLATFSLDASALGSERVAISGTISRYTRWKATRSGSAGDTVEMAVNLIRF